MATPLVQSVLRALGVLDELVGESEANEAGSLALSELARRSDLRPNTLHNLLRSLIAAGYAEPAGDGRYRIGPKCRAMGMRNRVAIWAETVRPLVDELITKTGESAVFCSLAGTERLTIYLRESHNPVRATSKNPAHRHFYSLATSRVLAAWSDQSLREALLARWGIPGREFNGLRSARALNAALDLVRETGYARCLTHDDQVTNWAVPVHTPAGKLLGALGCYAPTFRSPPKRDRLVLTVLRQTAASIGAALGAWADPHCPPLRHHDRQL